MVRMTSPFGVAAAIAVAIALSPTVADAGSVTLQYLVTVDHEQRADSFGGCCVHSAITPIQFTLDVTLYDQVLGPSGAYAMDFAAPTFSAIPLGDGLPAFTSGLARVGNQPAPYVDYAQATASARVATSSADGSTTINSRSVALSHQTSAPARSVATASMIT
jgi:hypothetical protein